MNLEHRLGGVFGSALKIVWLIQYPPTYYSVSVASPSAPTSLSYRYDSQNDLHILTKSSFSGSHHRLGTFIYRRISAAIHRSTMGLVTMYCATMF